MNLPALPADHPDAPIIEAVLAAAVAGTPLSGRDNLAPVEVLNAAAALIAFLPHMASHGGTPAYWIDRIERLRLAVGPDKS